MKNLIVLLISFFFLVSCSSNSDKPQENKPTSLPETSADSINYESGENSSTTTLSVKAKFIEFHLGDAEHYLFEDETGKSWDFAGSECDKFDFTHELNEVEANESNQGWGSNNELQGKWFNLTYIKREQPQYIDGPVVTVEVITEAILIK